MLFCNDLRAIFEIDFSGMENGCLDGVLMVKALYGLGSVLRCFGWCFHGWVVCL